MISVSLARIHSRVGVELGVLIIISHRAWVTGTLVGEHVPARLQYFFVILGLDLSVWQ
jgi:hypothetical protein